MHPSGIPFKTDRRPLTEIVANEVDSKIILQIVKAETIHLSTAEIENELDTHEISYDYFGINIKASHF